VTDPSALLDTVNRRLLHELAAEPRITMSALARRVGMSAPAVTERVQRLEQAGVITARRPASFPRSPNWPPRHPKSPNATASAVTTAS
jgi:Lrp/AsnC family leucine-responsive transcriptional regulator